MPTEEKVPVRISPFNPEFIGYVMSGVAKSNALLGAIMKTLKTFSKKEPSKYAELMDAIFDEYEILIEKEKEKARLMDMDLSDQLKKDIGEILENPPGSGTRS